MIIPGVMMGPNRMGVGVVVWFLNKFNYCKKKIKRYKYMHASIISFADFQLFSLSVVPGQFLGHRRGAKFDVDLYWFEQFKISLRTVVLKMWYNYETIKSNVYNKNILNFEYFLYMIYFTTLILYFVNDSLKLILFWFLLLRWAMGPMGHTSVTVTL